MLGQAMAQALGDKSDIKRYGHAYIPMDEALGSCVVDISGRPFLVFQAAFPQEALGAFAMHSGLTLHLACPYGKNSHHMIEALFKACAHAMRDACALGQEGVLSSKGML